MSQSPLLRIKDLSIDFQTPNGTFHAVDKASFEINRGETVALVGESGSGKSITALSVMQLLPYPLASHPQGSSIQFNGEELVGKGDSFMQSVRGRQIGMIFQEPLTALNPLHTIEKQIGEMLRLHQNMNVEATKERVLELLDLVGLPKLKDRLGAYPHELSGGQRQRIMIAMALANNPDLLIADEPTTALDVTVQAQILELLQDLKERLNMALLLITHDLSIVEKMTDKVCVMEKGLIVEQKATTDLFKNPQHAYTKRLLAAQPKSQPPEISANQNHVPLLRAQNLKVHFPIGKTFLGKPKNVVRAVDDISFSIQRGQTLGVVGESGSGKSTLGMALLRLHKPEGSILFDGQELSTLNQKQMRPYRSRMQIVFQDPFGSLSPRMSIAGIISEGLDIHKAHLSKADQDDLVIQALKSVQMDPDSRHRYPHEFSGGQRQRISIARAMVLEPEFLILDEPTSALDVSVQAEIVDLLRALQAQHNLTYMFISHDLKVVRAMAHNLLVMKDGKVVESGNAQKIFKKPQESYTQSLLEAALNLSTKAA